MKALIVNKPGKYSIADIPIPEPGDHDVLVKNHFAGFCGTDTHILNGDYLSTYPLIPGHEFAGVVKKTGAKVRRFKNGDNVVIDPNICCGKCNYCLINEQNFCTGFGGYGVTENGGFAEYSLIKDSNLHKIDGVSLEEAALLEPLACVIYGLSRFKINYGDTALIFGAGPIGIILLQMLKISGISMSIVIDIDEEKLETARSFGAAHTFLNDRQLGKNLGSVSSSGYEILIDATGIKNVIEQVFDYVDYNSKILLYGVSPQNSTINISQFNIFRKNLSIYGAYSYNRTIPKAIRLLRNKKINLKDLISHKYKLTEFNEALEVIKTGSHSKVIIDCNV